MAAPKKRAVRVDLLARAQEHVVHVPVAAEQVVVAEVPFHRYERHVTKTVRPRAAPVYTYEGNTYNHCDADSARQVYILT